MQLLTRLALILHRLCMHADQIAHRFVGFVAFWCRSRACVSPEPITAARHARYAVSARLVTGRLPTAV